MDFDFYQQFADYSTADLLKITRQADRYQPDALAAAETLLRERTISPDDEEEADLYFRDIAAAAATRSEHLNFYKEKVTDIIEPILVPGGDLPPARWYNLLLIGYGILYIYTFYAFINKQLHFLRCENCRSDFTLFTSFLNIVFISLIYLLLIKRRRWGWILLFAGNMSAIPTNILQLYYLYKYRHVFPVSIGPAIFIQVYPVALLIFLWKEPISTFFGVDELSRKKTAWTGLALGLLYCVVIMGF